LQHLNSKVGHHSKFWRSFALSAAEVAHFDQQEEHIASKTSRLLDQLLELGDNLSSLADTLSMQTAIGANG
jgi:hypothetical protein